MCAALSFAFAAKPKDKAAHSVIVIVDVRVGSRHYIMSHNMTDRKGILLTDQGPMSTKKNHYKLCILVRYWLQVWPRY